MNVWSLGFSLGFSMAGPGPWSSGFSLGFGPLSFVDASGLATDSMQLLGYSSSQKLFYDEANTEAFYLTNVTSSTITVVLKNDFNSDFNSDFGPPTQFITLSQVLSLARVSPLYARDWLVFSGAASTWVYNPFGSSPYRNFSNVV